MTKRDHQFQKWWIPLSQLVIKLMPFMSLTRLIKVWHFYFSGVVFVYKNYLCNIASLKTIILMPCVEELQTLPIDSFSCSARTMMGLGDFEVLGIRKKMPQEAWDSCNTSDSVGAGGWHYTVSTENRGPESRIHSEGI